MGIGQDVFQIGNGGHDFFIFILNFLPFQSGQALQTHIQNRLCLPIGEAEFFHQGLFGHITIGTLPDRCNHSIQMIQRNFETFQDMRPVFGFAQFILAFPGNDILLVLQIVFQNLFQVQHPGMAINQRQHNNPKRILELGMLVQLVQHHFRLDIAAQFNNDPHALPIGFIPKVGNAFQGFILHQFGNIFNQPCLVDLIGDLRHHNPVFILWHGLHMGLSPYLHHAASGSIGLPDTALP